MFDRALWPTSVPNLPKVLLTVWSSGPRPGIGNPRRNQTSGKKRCVELILPAIALGDEDPAHSVANPRETFFVGTKVARVLQESEEPGRVVANCFGRKLRRKHKGETGTRALMLSWLAGS